MLPRSTEIQPYVAPIRPSPRNFIPHTERRLTRGPFYAREIFLSVEEPARHGPTACLSVETWKIFQSVREIRTTLDVECRVSGAESAEVNGCFAARSGHVWHELRVSCWHGGRPVPAQWLARAIPGRPQVMRATTVASTCHTWAPASDVVGCLLLATLLARAKTG